MGALADMPKKIVVVGSINIDLVTSVLRMPREGETVFGTGFAIYSGGKGANQAVAAARLGAEVRMVGMLGNDTFGEQLRVLLETEGVLVDSVGTVVGPSGSALIIVSAQGHNSIVVISGANAGLGPGTIDQYQAELKDAAIILTQLETPLETVERLAELAVKFEVPLILDPAPARILPEHLLKNVAWLTPNESETITLLNGMGISLQEPIKPVVAAKHLLKSGVRNVLLKLGPKGVFMAGKDVEPVHVPPFSVEPADTTAAGDAFNGGFAFALSTGMKAFDAARFANAVAAVSVTRIGAQPSMPTYAEVSALIASDVVGSLKLPGRSIRS